MVPRIVHQIYFPWDREGKLLADCHAFDHAPHQRMVAYAQGFQVELWTLDRAKFFCREHYPAIWDVMQELAHPTMMVDVLRWLVVYHFGGIYWQYDMDALVNMDKLLPAPGKSVRLFTEFVNDAAFCQRMAEEPIRKGVPEEAVRVCNQCFVAELKHPFIKRMLDTIVERASTLTPERDYDILYICANAVVSTVYDQYGKSDSLVELTSREETRRKIKIKYRGSWRKARGDTVGGGHQPSRSDSCSVPRFWIKAMLQCIPGVYRIRPHAHEVMLRRLRSDHPDLIRIDPKTLEALVQNLQDAGAQRVLVYPAAHVTGLNAAALPMALTAWDPVRVTSCCRFRNILCDRVPDVDAVVVRNLFDYLCFAAIRALLERLKRSSVKQVIATGYPCLNANWDTYDGEVRPVHLARPPFALREVQAPIPDFDVAGRPDRSLCFFALDDLGSSNDRNKE